MDRAIKPTAPLCPPTPTPTSSAPVQFPRQILPTRSASLGAFGCATVSIRSGVLVHTYFRYLDRRDKNLTGVLPSRAQVICSLFITGISCHLFSSFPFPREILSWPSPEPFFLSVEQIQPAVSCHLSSATCHPSSVIRHPLRVNCSCSTWTCENSSELCHSVITLSRREKKAAKGQGARKKKKEKDHDRYHEHAFAASTNKVSETPPVDHRAHRIRILPRCPARRPRLPTLLYR